MPRRLLDVGHVTCFRVRDWVTRVIRGAGREFCQRRVNHTHSRPATVIGWCQASLLWKRKIRLEILVPSMEGEFVLKYDPILEEVIHVA